MTAIALPAGNQRSRVELPRHYALVFGAVATALVMRFALDPYLGDRLPYATFFVAVTVVAWYRGLGPTLFALVVGACVSQYFFVPPRHSVAIHGVANLVAFGVYFIVTVPIAFLADRQKRDANARLKAEEHLARQQVLQESEKQFRTLANAIPQLCSIANADGWIFWYNQRWYEYTGTTPQQMEGWGWQSVHDPEMLPAVLAQWKDSLATGKPFDMVFPLRGADGVFRPFLTRIMPVRDSDGNAVRWFGTNTDISEQRKTEAALGESKERLQLALSAAGAGTWEWRLERNEYVYSEEARNLFGLGSDNRAPSYHAWLEAVHPDDRAPIGLNLARAAITGSALNIEYRVCHGDGTVRWLLSRGHALRDNEGCPARFIGIVLDITQRKWAEEVLTQASEQRRLALEAAAQTEMDQKFLLELGAALQAVSSPDAIAELATRMTAHQFAAARSAVISVDVPGDKMTRLYEANIGDGISPLPFRIPFQLSSFIDERMIETLASGNTVAIGDTATVPFAAAHYLSAYKTANVQAFMLVPWLREGQWMYTMSVSVPEPRQWTHREMELLRKASEQIWPFYEAARARVAERSMNTALGFSEERLKLALQVGAIGTWEINLITGVTLMDAPLKALYGFPPEVQRETIRSCIHPEDRDMVARASEAFHDSAGMGRLDLDYRILRWDDRSLRHLHVQGQMFFEGEGQNRRGVRSIGTLQDMTGVREREEALIRANRELEEFAYAAAHDLQEPLRNISLTTQLLARQLEGRVEVEAARLLKAAVDEPLRMHAMVKDLLSFARALDSEEGDAEVRNSDAALESALRNLHAAIQEKRAEVTWDTLPVVQMSQSHLVRVFQNLIGNSLKYSGVNQPRIHISSRLRDGICLFSVEDHGLGIPPEYRDLVFGVFKRLHDRSVPGTGIGLALCRRIVENYGGKIWIESPTNEGITFLFTPPMVMEQQNRRANA